MLRLSLCSGLICLAAAGAPAHDGHSHSRQRPGKVNTSRPMTRVLPLAKEDDAFHFIIFGDRTGGPADGVKVLAQAVKDANLLDPDLVMTVGDLVEGYNDDAKWLTQAAEFKSIMNRLKMPWYPVAGNHDVYYRGTKRPAGGHEKNYERHFGPLWYWFAHKQTGFLVLYTDEDHPVTGKKGYGKGDPVLNHFSEKQLGWLKKSLAEMKSLKQVFVFVHHPRWVEMWYPGSNWPVVHKLLDGAGNVRAVFAGHIHRMRYDGKRNGIEYFSLAATGAGIPGLYPKIGYLHHMNIVTVREDGYSVSAIPVGAVIDPRQFTALRQKDVDLLRGLAPKPQGDGIQLNTDGSGAGYVSWELTNPASRDIEVTLNFEAGSDRWLFVPDHRHLKLKPGEKRTVEFAWARRGGDFGRTFRIPALTQNIDYLETGSRIAIPARRIPPSLSLRTLPEEFFTTKQNGAVQLNGRGDCLRIEAGGVRLPDGPLTVETWIKPAALVKAEALIAKTEQSEFGLYLVDGKPTFDVHLNGHYVTVTGGKLAKNRWVHLAGVFDGTEVRLYIDGKRVAAKPGKGKRKLNRLPLYVGADPDRRGNPTKFFKGLIDEVRVSRTARYAADFTPTDLHLPDEHTEVLLHLDRDVGPFWPDHSPRPTHATARGQTRIVKAVRP